MGILEAWKPACARAEPLRAVLGGLTGMALLVVDGYADLDLRGPRPGRQRDQDAEPAADPGVQDGGRVAGAGQVPLADRVGEDLGGV